METCIRLRFQEKQLAVVYNNLFKNYRNITLSWPVMQVTLVKLKYLVMCNPSTVIFLTNLTWLVPFKSKYMMDVL